MVVGLPDCVLVLLGLVGAVSSVSLHVLGATTSTSVRVPVTKHVKHEFVRHAAARDRARARALVQRVSSTNATASAVAARIVEGIDITNIVTAYVATVNVGFPPTPFSLVVDTGSSNTWVGATTRFTATDTTHSLGLRVAVQYNADMSFTGQQVLDQVAIASALVIPQQSIGVAARSQGFQGLDGVLGLGPDDLTVGTVQNTSTVPTVTDSLFGLHIISQPIIGVSFAPTNLTFATNGVLTFGGVDETQFIGELMLFSVTATFPASQFFGIDASFVQGGTTIASGSGIVDTGTTLLMLATPAFNAYARRAGASLSRNVGLLTVTPEEFAALPALELVVDGASFSLTPDAQRWPRQLNEAIGGTPDAIYLVVGDLGINSFDFVLGQFFLERFYSVYSTTGFVGLAPTVFTNATTNN